VVPLVTLHLPCTTGSDIGARRMRSCRATLPSGDTAFRALIAFHAGGRITPGLSAGLAFLCQRYCSSDRNNCCNEHSNYRLPDNCSSRRSPQGCSMAANAGSFIDACQLALEKCRDRCESFDMSEPRT
jgi:hypothetical protein